MFASIACATRFTQFDKQEVFHGVRCFGRGGEDSLAHLLACSDLAPVFRPILDQLDGERLLDFVYKLIRETARHAPIWPQNLRNEPDTAEQVEIGFHVFSEKGTLVFSQRDTLPLFSVDVEDESAMDN